MTDQALTIEQAVAAIASDAPEETSTINTNTENTGADDATEVLEQDSEADPDELLTDDEDAALDEPSGDVDGDDGEEEEDESPSLPAPEFWDDEAKAEWASLSRSTQEILSKTAKKSSDALAKQMQTAAETRKAAESEAKTLNAHRTQLEQLLEAVVPAQAHKWDNIDWATWMASDFQAATTAKAQMEQERAHLQQLQAAKEQSDAVYHQTFLKNEAEALRSMAEADPITKRLFDPNKGQASLTAVQEYLVKSVPAIRDNPKSISWVGAAELAIAHKAMLYDNLQARQLAKNSTPAQKAVTQTSQGTKVRAPTTPATPASVNTLTAQKQRLAKTGSIDDAVTLILMQESARKKGK